VVVVVAVADADADANAVVAGDGSGVEVVSTFATFCSGSRRRRGTTSAEPAPGGEDKKTAILAY